MECSSSSRVEPCSSSSRVEPCRSSHFSESKSPHQSLLRQRQPITPVTALLICAVTGAVPGRAISPSRPCPEAIVEAAPFEVEHASGTTLVPRRVVKESASASADLSYICTCTGQLAPIIFGTPWYWCGHAGSCHLRGTTSGLGGLALLTFQ